MPVGQGSRRREPPSRWGGESLSSQTSPPLWPLPTAVAIPVEAFPLKYLLVPVLPVFPTGRPFPMGSGPICSWNDAKINEVAYLCQVCNRIVLERAGSGARGMPHQTKENGRLGQRGKKRGSIRSRVPKRWFTASARTVAPSHVPVASRPKNGPRGRAPACEVAEARQAALLPAPELLPIRRA